MLSLSVSTRPPSPARLRPLLPEGTRHQNPAHPTQPLRPRLNLLPPAIDLTRPTASSPTAPNLPEPSRDPRCPRRAEVTRAKEMSARLRVEELRAKLQQRGLDASGNKPALVSLEARPYLSASIPTPFRPNCNGLPRRGCPRSHPPQSAPAAIRVRFFAAACGLVPRVRAPCARAYAPT